MKLVDSWFEALNHIMTHETNDSIEQYHFLKQALNRLDELEAKATMLDKLLAKSMPRIPNGCKNDWGCPTCDSTIEYDDFEYYPHCGQKLDWGK